MGRSSGRRGCGGRRRAGSVVLACLAVLAVRAGWAQSDGAYFTAMVAPLGSISSPGQGQLGVYLRWDVVEGDFPADLASFRLERDGVVIHEGPASGALSAPEIEALYAGAAQSRRKAETLRWLNELSQTQEAPGPVVDAGNFAAALRERLLGDRYWALFAARSDFNVARAYRRGFLDATATGVHTYELVGISTTSQQSRIGLITVDSTTADVLPVAADLQQVVDFGRCDAPERNKDHATVVLNWDQPGTGAGDKYVATLLTAGFDLYRTTTNVAAVDPALDIRSLAQGVAHDAGGNVALAGLERMNDQPIVISGSAQEEQIGDGWHPPYFQYLETGPEVLAAGLAPGDQRAYYLVARDFTGNYGATAAVLVTVPDAVAPPPPWAMRTVMDPAGDTFALEWDAVDVLNFVQAHQGRTYCNLATAAAERAIRWVKEGTSCAGGFQVPVDLDTVGYLVYRFSTSEEAARFTDSDGDGRADVDERVALSAIRPLTDSGSACDAAVFPPGAQNFLVGTVPAASAIARPSGRKVLRFADPEPRDHKGDVYWYRLATLDPAGNLSPLSAPVRALFPNREKPQRCDPQGRGGVLTEPVCRYAVATFYAELDEPYAEDTTKDAASVVTSCARDAVTELAFPIEELDGGRRGVRLGDEVCEALVKQCTGASSVEVRYLAPDGTVLGSAAVDPPGDQACREVERTRLDKDCRGVRTVQPGDVLHGVGPLRLDCPTEPDECLTLYRDIGGVAYKYRTYCPATGPISFDPADLAHLGGGDQVCLSLAIHNQNSEVSTKLRLPCFRLTALLSPHPPQPVEIRFTSGSSEAELVWVPPEQPVTGTIVEWFLNGEDESGEDTRYTDFFPHAGADATDGTVQVTALITPEPAGTDWEQEWCFRARSVGQGGSQVISEWSHTRCGLRIPATDPLPEYIPWPKIATPPEVGTLLNRYLSLPGVPVIRLSEEDIVLDQRCDFAGERPQCRDPQKDECLARGADRPVVVQCQTFGFCAALQESVAGKLDFVVYRQSTDDPANPARYGDYVQVSPFIDRVFCKRNFLLFQQTQTGQELLDDPFLKLVDFTLPADPAWDGLRLVFADATPHIAGRHYRYQVVYLGADGEIVGHRQTDWFQAQ